MKAPKTKLTERLADSIGDFVRRVRQQSSVQQLSSYDAAKKDRTNRDWRTRLSSADQALLDDLDTLLARSRAMIRNDGYAASSQGAYRRYVVGSGITARSSARHPETGEMLKGFNKSLDMYWDDWATNPELCDVEKTKTLGEKQALWMNELFAAGGVFIVLGYTPNAGNVGLTLQEIEYEQVDNLVTEFNGHPVRDGIEVDNFGAPLGYHLHIAAHPLEEYSTKPKRLAAGRVIHLFRQDRVRQKRGAVWMATIMGGIRNLSMYEQYMTLKARTEAAYNGFVTQAETGANTLPKYIANQIGAASGTETVSESTDELEVKIQTGLFPILKPGQDIKFPQPASPNSQYTPFVSEQLKRISAGTGLDLATVARWYADGNFSSQQMAKMEMWAETDAIQQTLFIDKAMRRIRREFIELGIREGFLHATGYYESLRWRKAYLTTNWKGPPKPIYNQAKYAAAVKLLMGMGLMSPQDYANERGQDIRDIYSAIAEAQQMRAEYGIDGLIDQTFGKVDPNEPRPDKKQPDESKPGTAPSMHSGQGGNGDLAAAMMERLLMDGVLGE